MADQFLDWYRSSLFGLAADPAVGGRLQAALPVTLTDADSGATAGGATPFELLGPGDVIGLDPLAITLRYPRPGASNAEATKAAHVEFAEPDLPWRYTPAATTTNLTAMGKLINNIFKVEAVHSIILFLLHQFLKMLLTL